MAAIRETLILEDRFTSTMIQYLQVMQRMANMLDDVRASTMDVETAVATTIVQMQELVGKMTQTNSRGTPLLGMIHNLADTFLGMQSVRWPVNISDQLASTNARLRLITGSAEAAAAAQEEVYQVTMRSRGAYADMADFVSQLGTVAGNSFTGTDESVTFAEQIQKQMVISGASDAFTQAALVQLTQGLTFDTLRGGELNSVLEQTPMIAQTIAEYMGVTTGETRELASEGKVTAEVAKNAMLGAAEETNAQLEQMSMTWAQVWAMLQNATIQAPDLMLDAIPWLANNIDLVGPVVLGLGVVLGVFLLVANWTNVCTTATMALITVQGMLRTVMVTTWGLSSIIIALVIGAVYTMTVTVNHFAGTSVSATGITAGVIMTALIVVENLFVALFNLFTDEQVLIYNPIAVVTNFIRNASTDPTSPVTRLFFDLTDTVLGVLQAIASAIDTVFRLNLAGAVQGWRDSPGGWVDKAFGQGTEVMAKFNANNLHLGRFEHGVAFGTGYNWGANLPSGNGNDAVGAALSGAPYDELSGQLGDIVESVRNIEKSVKMSDEDIKSLADVAERRYVNNINLTVQTPVITISGANIGRTAADHQSLANVIRDILIEQIVSGSTRSMARPASG